RIPPDLRRSPDGSGSDRLDVVLAADGRRARHVRVRQEDAGLRLRLQQAHRRRGQCLQGFLANQLHLGRQSRRHDSLRAVPRDHRGRKDGRKRADGRRLPVGPPARNERRISGPRIERARARSVSRFGSSRQGNARPRALRLFGAWPHRSCVRIVRHSFPAGLEPVPRRSGRRSPEAAPRDRRREKLTGSLVRRLLAMGLAVGGVALGAFYLTLPDVSPLAKSFPQTTSFMERRRQELSRARQNTRLEWTPVPLARISPALRQAVIIAEDARFYEHGGVDGAAVRGAPREDWVKV